MGKEIKMNGKAPDEMKVSKTLPNPMRFMTQIGNSYTKIRLKNLEAEQDGKIRKFSIKSIKVIKAEVDWACALELVKYGIKTVGIMPIRVLISGRVTAWVTEGDQPPVYVTENIFIPFDCNNHNLEVNSEKFNPLSEAIAPKGLNINQFENGDCKILITF